LKTNHLAKGVTKPLPKIYMYNKIKVLLFHQQNELTSFKKNVEKQDLVVKALPIKMRNDF
jgi:hypothetical protein